MREGRLGRGGDPGIGRGNEIEGWKSVGGAGAGRGSEEKAAAGCERM